MNRIFNIRSEQIRIRKHKKQNTALGIFETSSSEVKAKEQVNMRALNEHDLLQQRNCSGKQRLRRSCLHSAPLPHLPKGPCVQSWRVAESLFVLVATAHGDGPAQVALLLTANANFQANKGSLAHNIYAFLIVSSGIDISTINAVSLLGPSVCRSAWSPLTSMPGRTKLRRTTWASPLDTMQSSSSTWRFFLFIRAWASLILFKIQV